MRIWFENHFFGVALIASFRRSVTKVPLSTWAALVLLFGPFLSITIAPFFLKGFDRFGVQWHILLISCLLSTILVVIQRGFPFFLRALLRNKSILSLLCIFVAWLIAMVIVHGFFAQLESVLSALMMLLMLPILLYIVSFFSGRWRLSEILLAIFLLLAFVENIFLSRYFLGGMDLNYVDLVAVGAPRLFLNARDGNFLMLVQFLLLCKASVGRVGDFCLSRYGSLGWSLLFGFGIYQPFYNAFLTQGRALLLCLVIGVALIFVLAYGYCLSAILRFALVSVGAGCMSLFTLRFLSPLAISSPEVEVAKSMVERADGGRFELWRHWIEAGLSNSSLWGGGLGFLPDFDGVIPAQFTPHNIFVQLVADSGFSSFVLMMLIFYCLLREKRRVSQFGWFRLGFERALVTVFCFLAMMYFQLGSVLFWPVGVFCTFCLAGAIVEGGSVEGALYKPSQVNSNALSASGSISMFSVCWICVVSLLVLLLSWTKYFTLYRLIVY